MIWHNQSPYPQNSSNYDLSLSKLVFYNHNDSHMNTLNLFQDRIGCCSFNIKIFK